MITVFRRRIDLPDLQKDLQRFPILTSNYGL